MLFSILSETLQKKLPFINHAISSRTQLPVLSNLLLQAQKNTVTISATDLEIGIQISIPANIEREGGITVPARIFTELIQSLPQEKITIELEGQNLVVKSSKTKSVFQTIPQEEFPTLYEEKGEEIAIIKKEIIEQDFQKVVFAASIDQTRPALSGILLKPEEEGFLIVATDGYRLSLKRHVSEEGRKKDEEKKSLLIPSKVIRELLGIKSEEETIKLSVSNKNNQILFSQNDTVLIGRLLEAEFPNYERIIPTDYGTRMFFSREELQKAVKTCSIFARETANIVRVLLRKGKIIVSSNTPSVGENTVEIEASLSGEENEIAFNARYLLDFLSNIKEDDIVFEMSGPLNPGVFKIKDDESFLHIIMPIRVQVDGQ